MGRKKEVEQYKGDILINTFNSVTDAAKSIGTIKSNISKCCNGIIKEFHGFSFKYTGKITNEKTNNKPVKCPYCEKTFDTYNGLCKHIFKEYKHGEKITKEQLLTDYKYNGQRPKCKCGCGEYTTIIYTNCAHFADYVIGHNNKIHNNWGHNETAKLKSAETRRKQYLEGTREQWNKGKKWEDVFTPDKIEELRKTYKNKERNDKISKKLKGVKKTEEHKKLLKKAFNTEKYKKTKRDEINKRITNHEFEISSKIEKEFIVECIEPLNINFCTQYYISDLHHYCDVYIPDKNIIIEFQGDYWHANPEKYSTEILTEYQKKKVKKDFDLREYCVSNKIKLIEIWEDEYKSNKEEIKLKIKKETF